VGVDVGTGGARAVALDPAGTSVAAAEVSTAVPAQPDELIRAAPLLDALRAAVADLMRRRPDVRPLALAVGAQGPTTVDRRSGLALTYRSRFGKDRPPVEQYEAQRQALAASGGGPIEPSQLWDWLLEQLGAEPHHGRWPGTEAVAGFGSVRRTGERVGIATRGRLAVDGDVLLVAGAVDTLLAQWGAGLDRPGRALDAGGRSGGLAVAASSGTRVAGLWAHAAAAVGIDILGAPVSAHGLSMEWLATVSGRPIGELLQSAAAVEPGARGLVFLPYLEGERAPRFDPGLRGVLAGLDGQTTLPELARAVLEGSAYGLAHIASIMGQAGVAIEVLICGGRPAQSELWSGIKSAVLEVPVERSDIDLAAYGAALAAGSAVGWWPRPGEGGAGSWPRPAMSRTAAESDTRYRAGLRRFIAVGDAAAQWSRL